MSIEDIVERTIWHIIEKNYNVDQTSPYVLTYKHISMEINPVTQLTSAIMDILNQIVYAQDTPPLEDPENETDKKIENLDAIDPIIDTEEDYELESYFGWGSLPHED